jgi:beta-galactosidase
LRLEIDGPATLIGVENGDILDLEPHKVPTRKAFMGKVLALIQTTDVPGTITISVSGVGLQPQQIVIESLTNIK